MKQRNDITKLVAFHMDIRSFPILIAGHIARVVREEYLAGD